MSITAKNPANETVETDPPKKGVRRRQSILETARSILISGGAAELTMGRIAREENIALGNLQYYFPAKDNLIVALVDDLCAVYQAELDAEQNTDLSAAERLEVLARFVVGDYQRDEGSVVFWELWALSAHHEKVAASVNRLHVWECGIVTQLVSAINPQLDEAEVEIRAIVITAQFEGIGIFVTKGRPAYAQRSEIAEEMARTAVAIARARPAVQHAPSKRKAK